MSSLQGMKSYYVSADAGLNMIRADSLDEAIEEVRSRLLDGRIGIVIVAERTCSEQEPGEEFEPEEKIVKWKIANDIFSVADYISGSGNN